MFRPIYEPRTKAREYADLAINIYTGCNHGCVYCYAPRVLRKTREQFAQVEPRKNIVEATKRQLTTGEYKGKKIMLCFTCDPYPADVDTTATREVIKAIKEAGAHVQILTKGGKRAERDFDLLDENDSFGVTIAGDNNWTSINEPNASILEERYYTLKIAHDKGIKTWVSCEPVYSPSEVYFLLEFCEYIDFYKIGKLNYLPSNINWAEFGQRCERIGRSTHRNYYIKEDLRAEMEKEAQNAVE